VVYVSPLKALAVDIERNLRSPLAGIARIDPDLPPVSVGVRTGDTTPAERRRLATHPPDILITTPESLFLILTSAARDTLTEVETVIVDEVHSLAGSKRGSHLALSLERLDEIVERPVQRIGCSATVRPVEVVADFLAGGRPVRTVTPVSAKQFELRITVPVADLAHPPTAIPTDDPDAPPAPPSVWPHVERSIVDQIEGTSATLVFTNSRRLSERLTTRLNELWADDLAAAAGVLDRPRSAPATTRRGDGHGGADVGRTGVAGSGAPRQCQQGAPPRDRGRPEVRAAARCRGHEQPGARHRYGGGGPGGAGPKPTGGLVRPATDRTCRAPGGRSVARCHLSHTSRGPVGGSGHRRRDARRGPRAGGAAPPPAGRPGPTGGRDDRHGRLAPR
jgi:ATP-dependent Lhr-like helicase